MSDKLRSTFPISVSFEDGELPNSRKLSALGSQAKTGLRLIEYAIGDLWNSSGDRVINASSITTNALMIPNIGRYLGATKHLSPRMYIPSSLDRYTFSFHFYSGGGLIPSKEAVLDIPPDASNTTWNWSGTAPRPTGAPVASKALVTATGEWYVDYNTGWCCFYDNIKPNWTLEYQPAVSDIQDPYDTATYNIIPDPDTHSSYAFQGVKIQYVNGTDNSQGYYIFLPPRGPLDTRRVPRSPQDDVHTPSHSANFDTTPNAGSSLMWQSDTVDATITSGRAEHYRYILPPIITGNWSNGARLPDGLLYLWDPTGTGTILSGLTMSAETSATPRHWLFVASGTALDNYLSSATGLSKYPTANLQSSSHAASLYPSGGLKVVIIGADIAQSLSALWGKFLEHDHSGMINYTNGAPSPSIPISHSALLYSFEPDDIASLAEPYFRHSGLLHDYHPQYLHRKGLQSLRDRYKGGMLGDLYFCSTDSTNDYDNITSDSWGVRFGGSTTGPKMYLKGTTQQLTISTTDLKLEGTGAKYESATQYKYIWVDLATRGLGTAATGWYHGLSGSETCWISAASNYIYFNLMDWPENMSLTRFQVDWDAGVGNALSMTVQRITWPGASGGAQTVQDLIATESGLNYIATSGAARTWSLFTPTVAYAYSHETNKIVVRFYSDGAGSRVFGLRLQVSFTSVSKWA